ncbi:thioredoxin family protein [Kitasatospora sp. NPDC056184]|uniref:thioredoxin family protein n=1 Tax=Kitasatospora sp. NPDC056184 TaxID=3345738 RepID=UPI0035E17C79
MTEHTTRYLLFTSDTCTPCAKAKPVVQQAAEERGLLVQEVNLQKSPELFAEYDVRGVPALLGFDLDAEIGRKVGGLDAKAVRDLFDQGEAL